MRPICEADRAHHAGLIPQHGGNLLLSQTHAPVKPVKAVVLVIKYWWPGYQPEQALDIFQAPHVPLEARTNDPTGRWWQPARHGSTLETVRDYMQEHDLHILHVERIAQRRNQRWEGLYVVQIGREIPAPEVHQ